MSFVLLVACTAPDQLEFELCAAILLTTHGLLLFNVASTSDIQFPASSGPEYTTDTFCTRGNTAPLSNTELLPKVRGIGPPASARNISR